jgi:hypothetical protein
VTDKLIQYIETAIDQLGTAAEKLLQSWEHKQGGPPPTLFHFTDCQGLIGILTTQTLYASLATSLNDASETKYAISRLRSRLTTGSVPLKHLNPARLLKHSDERNFSRDYRAYICSFCGAAEAVHWLHYGRSGTGVALGFESLGLAVVNQFGLYPVIYDVEEQDKLVSAVIQLADEYAGEHGARFKGGDLFEQLAVSYLRLVAPRMKDPSFKAENEWRLFSNETWVPENNAENPPTRDTKFRVSNGRVMPFKEIKFEELPLKVIELGASAPMADNEQALAVLIEETLRQPVSVVRSPVPVRR